MPFPSTLSAFTTPLPTDKLSTTPHSAIEGAQNTALSEVQAFIGTESSTVGTLFYDIRGAGSSGGGHVQSANKGGTGQTSFTKGDLLVGQSSSVISKLGIGTNNTVLTADSTQASGVKWGNLSGAATTYYGNFLVTDGQPLVVTNITSYQRIIIVFSAFQTNSASGNTTLYLSTDNGSNYGSARNISGAVDFSSNAMTGTVCIDNGSQNGLSKVITPQTGQSGGTVYNTMVLDTTTGVVNAFKIDRSSGYPHAGSIDVYLQ